ncbi:MAG TPA: 16S rRNA (guanine(966)-N(2))-methyltransferase RsmD [Microbacteriaceae bacterium]|nr:16S rRNA (guanine(966)-N(2))-methyltransferase RsmD [Microbacteriaceae bacterium]
MTRIIAGFAGSRTLAVPKSGTRPTSDRVREAIFSALEAADAISGARVLDLYAGSGALGLEAASRGAAVVQLVERDPKAAAIAKQNAALVADAAGPAERPCIAVAAAAVQTWLSGAADGEAGWDLVFIDPPYELTEDALTAALASVVPLLAADAWVIVERSTRSPAPTVPLGLAPGRRRDYGETAVHWYRAS